jgi:hypothetical protein
MQAVTSLEVDVSHRSQGSHNGEDGTLPALLGLWVGQ